MRDPRSFRDLIFHQKIYSYFSKKFLDVETDTWPTKLTRLTLPKSYSWEEFKEKLNELSLEDIKIDKAETYVDQELYSVFRCFIQKGDIYIPFYQSDYYNVLTDRTLTYIGYIITQLRIHN